MLPDQIALGRQGTVRQALLQIARQCLGIAASAHNGAEALQERQGLGRRQRRLILDGVGDAAQQIGAGDGNAQRRRQLRNGQRKSARNMRQNLILICLVGTHGIHAGSISETRKNSIMSAS